MKITLNWLKKNEVCGDVVEWFKNQTETDGIAVVKSLVLHGKLGWANWIIVHLLDRKQRIQYAIFAAEQVIGIFEKKFPHDKRPRFEIDTARKVLARGSFANRAAALAAEAAEWVAEDAKWAAGAAEWAALAAEAAEDAEAAKWAAEAAEWAARAAEAAGAAMGAMKTKIINYGISLLDGEKITGGIK